MNGLQKAGGIGALVNAAAYIIGLVMVATLLGSVVELPPAEYVAYIAESSENHTLLYVWHLFIYVVAGVFMVPMALGFHDRVKDAPQWLTQSATAFGLIWAGFVIGSGLLIIIDLDVLSTLYHTNPEQAVTARHAMSAVESALGGGIELPGGLWALLVSFAALRVNALPRLLNYLGLIIGVSGILTVVPALYVMGYVFGLGFVVWFIWAGIVMVRGRKTKLATQTTGRIATAS